MDMDTPMAAKKSSSWSKGEDTVLREQVRREQSWERVSAALPGRSARSCRLRCWTWRRHPDGTLPLFPLVPGDVRRPSGRGGGVLRRQPHEEAAGDDQSGACLALFPLAPGDLTKGSNSAREAAAMDVDVSAGGLPEMRLSPAPTAMAAFRAMVQAVRAPQSLCSFNFVVILISDEFLKKSFYSTL
ncbi:hypothetical protein C2845_PM06G10370 [Panicum miliaceum]|uniref:Myb-like domain-containing protein n=1 Tax=Panicum miliaceum TaxID=4540 RepID=A0A3L6RB77_PANMI|nr:hypothetical protein C2845_PM06G10370 [Panicum miliaceum]